MKARLSRFLPPFLKQLDSYLSQNYPVIWMSKVHIVLCYCGIVAFGIGILCFIPLSRYNLPDPDKHFLWACIPAAIAFLCWGVNVSEYNIERLGGTSSLLLRLRLQGCYLICLLTFASLPFLYAQSIAYRGAHSIPDQVLSEQNRAFDFIQDRVFSESFAQWKEDLRDTPQFSWAEDSIFQVLSLDDKQQALDIYFELCLDYSGLELSPTGKEKISAAFLNQEILVDTVHTHVNRFTLLDPQDETIIHGTEDRLHVLTTFKKRWEHHSWDFQKAIAVKRFIQHPSQNSTLNLLYMLLYCFLIVLLFVRLGFQRFFSSLACCLVLFFVLIPAQIGFLRGLGIMFAIDPDDDTLFLACWGFVNILIWLSLLLFSYSKRSQRMGRLWNAAILMFLTLFSPLLTWSVELIYSEFFREYYHTEAISLGIFVAPILWNLILDRQLISIHSRPYKQ